MSKLPNKFEIIRRARSRETELLRAIRMKCGDCLGYFLDTYEPCTSDNCPLRPYYPTAGMVKSPNFKNDLVKLVKAYDNPPNIIAKIKKLEPEINPEQDAKKAKDGERSN